MERRRINIGLVETRDDAVEAVDSGIGFLSCESKKKVATAGMRRHNKQEMLCDAQ
jgi:hypothetical protein